VHSQNQNGLASSHHTSLDRGPVDFVVQEREAITARRADVPSLRSRRESTSAHQSEAAVAKEGELSQTSRPVPWRYQPCNRSIRSSDHAGCGGLDRIDTSSTAKAVAARESTTTWVRVEAFVERAKTPSAQLVMERFRLADIVSTARRLPEWAKRPARLLGARRIARLLAPQTARRAFAGLDDTTWLAVLVASIKQPVQNGVLLPGFPSAEMQIHSVGNAYEVTLAEAARFYSFVRQTYATRGEPIDARTKILDFGVGWGRIIRFFLKDTDPECLYGVDVSEQFLEAARQTGCRANLQKIEPLGSMFCYPDATFDVVYAYSVFTHLPEAVQDRWLSEIQRVLRPGGIFVATVESPRLLEQRLGLDPSDESLHPRERRLATMIATDPAIRARLIARGFTHVPQAPTYGDTLMTEEYLRSHWGAFFEVVDFIDDAKLFVQAVVSLRRPARHH